MNLGTYRWLPALTLAAAFALASCGEPIPLETKTIFPRNIWTFYAGASDDATWACFPVTCFNTNGTGPSFLSAPGQFTVGFDYWYDPGTLPCNCWAYVSHAYRGAVLFNTTDMPKTLVTAQLIVHVDDAVSGEDSDVSNIEDGTISGIFLASSPWYNIVTEVFTDSNGTDTANVSVPGFGPETNAFIVPFPKNPPADFPKSGPQVRKSGNTYTIDVTHQVRDWVANKEPNFGFIFVGQNESLEEKVNKTRVARYKVTLQILHNPKQP